MTPNRKHLRLSRTLFGALAVSKPLSCARRPVSRRTYALLGAASLSGAGLAISAPKSASGTSRAWTSGPQTTIRVRPSDKTPCVAKVGPHMPIQVWGKFQGWYRVETQDHIFGWVQHQNLSVAQAENVVTMSADNAYLASDRTGDQVMFGSPQMLRAYYNRFKAKGAAKGLALQGIYISRVAPVRIAKKPAQPRVTVAAVANQRQYFSSGTLLAPPTQAELMAGAATTSPAKTQISAPLESEILSVQTERTAINAQPLPPIVNSTLAPRTFPATNHTIIAAIPAVPAPRVVKAVPLPKPMVKVAAPKPAKKLTAKQKKYLARANAKSKSRETIRAKMGWSNQTLQAPKPLAPFSPDDLLKAREAYLQAQRAKAAPAVPVQMAESQAPANAAPQVAPAPPATFQPSNWSANSPLSGELNGLIFGSPQQRQSAIQTISRLDQADKKAQLPFATAPLNSSTLASAKKMPSSPPAFSRGGSPTDRSVAAWRSGMASQALSYRGMPYRFGAASPTRGFDCSGLIYFLLRQRGYNPPRTAAGYKNYGTAVERGKWQTGDLILFSNTYKRGISHIGIYLKDNKFVHAATTHSGVRVDTLSGYYSKKYYGARRVK